MFEFEFAMFYIVYYNAMCGGEITIDYITLLGLVLIVRFLLFML